MRFGKKIEMKKPSILLKVTICASVFLFIVFLSYSLYGKGTFSAEDEPGTCYICDGTRGWEPGDFQPQCSSTEIIGTAGQVTANACFLSLSDHYPGDGTRFYFRFYPNDGNTDTIQKTCYYWTDGYIACYDTDHYSNTLTIPSLNSWSGHTLKGWSISSDELKVDYPVGGTVTNIDRSKASLTAIWVNSNGDCYSYNYGGYYSYYDSNSKKCIEYNSIRLNPNGGTWSDGTSDEKRYNFKTSSVSQDAPVREFGLSRSGYVFDGWEDEVNGGETKTGDFTASDNELIFNAKWKKNDNDFSVIFYKYPGDERDQSKIRMNCHKFDDGQVSCSQGNSTFDAPINFPTLPALDGHTLKGWSRCEYADVSYGPNDTVTPAKNSADCFEAIWVNSSTNDCAFFDDHGNIDYDYYFEDNKCNLYKYFEVEPNGGTWSDGSSDEYKTYRFKPNQTVKARDAINSLGLTKSGYEFAGLQDVSVGDDIIDADEDVPSSFYKLRLQAIWAKPTPKQYTVYLNLEGGKAANTNETKIPISYYDSITFSDIYDWYTGNITKSGYILSGWCYDKDCSGTRLTKFVDDKEDGKNLYAYWVSNDTPPDISDKIIVTFYKLDGLEIMYQKYCDSVTKNGAKVCPAGSVTVPTECDNWCRNKKSCDSPETSASIKTQDFTDDVRFYCVNVDTEPEEPSKPSSEPEEPAPYENPIDDYRCDETTGEWIYILSCQSSSISGAKCKVKDADPVLISHLDDGAHCSDPKPGTNSSSSKGENVPTNAGTGSFTIIVAWLVGIAALVISFCYFRKNHFTNK